MKRVISIIIALVALVGAAQENQGFKLQFDQSKINPQFTLPELPATVSPATNIKPTFNANLPTSADLHLDFKNHFADSLTIYQQDWNNNALSSLPSFHYDTNPYSRDWSSSGVIRSIISWTA